MLSSFLLLYTLLLFIYFFLSSKFLIWVIGRCGNVSQKSTNSVTHLLLIFFLSLFTHEDSKKKKKWSSNAVCDIWGLVDVREIDGCRFETLFYLLIFGFWYYKIMVLGEIKDYWN